MVGRPILFVHGICDNANSFSSLQSGVIDKISIAEPEAYPDAFIYTLYYDPSSGNVLWFDNGTGNPVSLIPSKARFFAIEFYAPGAFGADGSVNAAGVADVSILNKADELAHVIEAITTLTTVKDVILIGHSMGGLDARAYMENFAISSAVQCTDAGAQPYSCITSPTTLYTGDVAKLITLDTPHSGAAIANVDGLRDDILSLVLGDDGEIAGTLIDLWARAFKACIVENPQDNLNLRELEEGSWVLQQLNGDPLDNNAIFSLPPHVPITAIRSYTLPGLWDYTNGDDGAGTKSEQGIQQIVNNLEPTTYVDSDNPFFGSAYLPVPLYLVSLGCNPQFGILPILHVLPCLGMQPNTAALIYSAVSPVLNGTASSISVTATLDGNQISTPFTASYSISSADGFTLPGTTSIPSTFYKVTPGEYTLQYTSGGPSPRVSISPNNQQTLGVNHVDGSNNWNLTFNLAFQSAGILTTVPSLSFLDVPVNSTAIRTIEITNTGNASVNIPAAPQISGTNASTFSVVSGPGSPIVAGKTASLTVAFSPTGQGNDTATLCVVSDAPGQPVCISLVGTTAPVSVPPSLSSPGSPTAPGTIVPTLTPTLTWQPVANASSYQLYVNEIQPGTTGYSNTTISGNSTSLTVPSGNLLAGRNYQWYMTAKTAAGLTSGNSPPLFFEVTNSQAAPFIDSIDPPNPTASATAQPLTINGSGFATGDVVQFTLPDTTAYRVPGNQLSIQSASMIATSAPLSQAGNWNVEVVNSQGQISNLFPFQIAPTPQKPGTFTLTGNPPTCNAPPSTVPLVSIAWAASTQASSYQIYRNSYSVASVQAGTLSWTDSADLTAGQSYSYSVVGVNAQGTTQSNTVTVSVPSNVCYTQAAGKIVLSQNTFNTGFTQAQSAASGVLTITDDSGKPMQGTASVATQQGGTWLTVDGHTNSETWYAPQSLTVTFNPTGLAAGNYSGTITITSPQASNGPLVVQVTMAVASLLVITTPPVLPDAFAGQMYSATLQATGGSSLNWTILNGSLPAGLSLSSSTGAISGTPGSSAGTQPLNIGVSDSAGQSVWQTFILNWNPAVAIATPLAGIPQWVVGAPIVNSTGYNFTASGGSAPYQWSATGLPSGVNLGALGTLSGTPTSGGTYNVTITVTDSGNRTGNLNVSIGVLQLPLQISGDNGDDGMPFVPSGAVGASNSAFFSANGGSGSSYRWTLSGALPPGISSGPAPGCTAPVCPFAIFGTPTTAGVFPLSLKLTDSAGNSTSTYLVSVVNNPGSAPKITYAELPVATIGTNYSFSFAATGGTGALTWKIDGPPADPSLAISTTGGLAATPGVANDCPGNSGGFQPPQYPVARVFVVQVTDSAGQSDAVPECMPAYYPQSTITTIYPPNAIPTGVAQTVAVVGTGFQTNSQLQFDNIAQTTTFVSESELQFTLNPAQIHAFQTPNGIGWDPYASYPIRVITPYSHPSSNANFEIDLPAPAVSTFEADYLGTAGSPCFPNFACELNITGTGLTPYTQFQLIGTGQTVEYESTTSTNVPWTQVTTAALFPTSAGAYTIQVTNPNQPGGGSASTTISLQVYDVTSIVPNPATVTKQVTQGDSATTSTLSVALAGLDRQPGTAAVSGGSWLKVNGQASSSFTTPVALSLTLDPTGLTPGTYTASITLTSSQAKNTGIVVPVTLTVSGPLQITTTSLPDAYSSKPYSTSIQASGGSGYTWSLQGGSLPPGLSLDPASGVISGTPDFVSTTVVESASISVLDSLGRSTSKTFSLNWHPGVTISLPLNGTPQWIVGTSIQNGPGYGFNALGGSPPYQWSATGLPSGIVLSAAGVLSGTPTAAGAYSVVLTLADSIGLTGTLALPLPVTQLPLNIVDNSFGNSPPVAPGGAVGADYPALFLSGAGGSQNGYRWIVMGTLPTGIVASPPAGCNPPGCAIGFSGSPSQAGTFPVSVQLADSANNTVATSLSFVINASPQTITFGTLASVSYGSAPFVVSATSNSGLPVSFSSTTPSVCTATSTGTVTIAAGGACSITASQSGNSNFAAAASVVQSFAVNPASQTIAFPTPTNVTLGSSPSTVSATATSSLPVSFASTTTSVCTATSTGTVSIIAVGTCSITASQGGNANFAAATSVSQSFMVNKASQTVTFAPSTSIGFSATTIPLTATASSGLMVGLASTTNSVCTLSGNALTTVALGTCTITASQGGSANYLAATPVVQNVTIVQGSQGITFAQPAAITLPASPLALVATASSGLTVTFNSTTSGICTVNLATLTPVSVGTCTITASQTGNTNYLAATPVMQSFTINPAASSGGGGGGGGAPPSGGSPLTLSPTSPTIGAAVGGSPATTTITLTYQTFTQGAPSFSSNFNTSPDQGWMSLSPASGTMSQASLTGLLYTYSATITVSGDPKGLAAGAVETGNININSGGNIVSATVTMNVSSQPAKFTVAPQSLSFTYQQGSTALPATQSVSVFSVPTGASFTATASSTGNWLTAGAGTATPAAIPVSVSVSGLAPGNYSGSIAIGAIRVPVSLAIVKATPPILSVSPTTENLGTATSGEVTVSNTGGGTLQFTASSDQPWLTTGGSGTATPGAPASLSFAANPSGLTPGVYTGHVTISDSNSAAQSVVTVVFTVPNTAIPVIQLSKSGVTLTGVASGAAPQTQTVTVTNTGTGTLNWTPQISTTSGGNWLTASGSGTSLSISASTTGLAAGQYYGSVNVAASNATNSPQSVSVVLNVLATTASPGISVSTGGLLLVGSGTQTVGLYNAGSTAIGYTASVFTSTGSGWLTVSPASGTANPGASTISIATNLSGLTGLQTGSVTLAFGDGSTATIQVGALALSGTAGSARSGGVQPLASVAACPGGKASYLIPIFREPSSQSSAQVASATTVQAQVIDDCGHAVTSGSVQVTFGNGDPGINLNSVGSGIWEATWVPQNAASSVALQVTASENGLIVNSSLSVLSSVTVVVLAASANAAPQPTGIANAASGSQATPEVVAPGSYIAIYGTGLAGGGNPAATSLPLPTTLDGTQLFLGGLPMPLLYAGGGQVNALVPEGIAPNATYPLVVVRGTAQSVPVALTVTELQPGAYTVNTSGSGAGIVTNALTGALITTSNPAHAGDYLVIYGTGLGSLIGANGEAQPSDGAVAPGTVVYHTTATVTATIGGVTTPVLFSGLTPTFAGLYQVNVQVPVGIAAGSAVPVVLTATDTATGVSATGNAVTVAVQ